MRVIDDVIRLDMVKLVDGRRLRDCKGIKRRTNSATRTLGGGVGGTHGDHHHVVRSAFEWSVCNFGRQGCFKWSVYNFGWFVEKGVLTEKHVLPLRATFLD